VRAEEALAVVAYEGEQVFLLLAESQTLTSPMASSFFGGCTWAAAGNVASITNTSAFLMLQISSQTG
jgi:hypothetical protein